ncbi:hypothetical protein TBR22_A09620 [Luteitalea sp. TBR-22]|uniref:PQQ-like beta-propeller repeat protein n=1 Tax=Luteitalea sp. TBR-22 TaxID=2802971 RepID=UPI001AF2C624|nr:PQQ-like beta-propeller repeat protein [Luteitalea sp. TBR-22]BCS31758.1 hypothetical protein TBR22_A09620 [Luteitalea sp. TBR-22]
MRPARWTFTALACLAAGSVGLAQVGRGGTRWFAPLADAQRTSWIRVDQKITPETMSAPGFRLQWTKAPGAEHGARGPLLQGVTASGVTLFVPMSVVTGAGDRVYALDNDIAHVVWQRALDVEDRASLPSCAGAITSAATRIVPLDGSATADPLARPPAPPGVGYRSLIGRPGEGNPMDSVRRQSQAARPATPAPTPAPAAGAPAAPGAASAAATTAAAPARSPGDIPGAPRSATPVRGLAVPSGVVYVVGRDGRLRVLGLASGKDLQKPATFLPRGARFTAPVGVDTRLYVATTGGCGGTADGVWSIDLDSEAKPVVSWKTNGGPVVGAVAFTADGTLLAAVGSGTAIGDGKANAIVALDPQTLAVKDWFTRPDADFVTGPTVIRVGTRDVVAAATRDGRVVVLDAGALGGADHATPLATSAPVAGAGGMVRRDAIAAWRQADGGDAFVLVPVDGPIAAGLASPNSPAGPGALVSLRLRAAADTVAVEPAWASRSLPAPATPLVVNGVVFALGAGRPAAGARPASGAVLQAYDGVTGKRLFTSGAAMTSPASPGSLWSGLGQVFVGTADGTIHAFGFDDERWALPRRR